MDDEGKKILEMSCKISDEGRAILKSGITPDGEVLNDKQLLLLEIASRVTTVKASHLLELSNEIINLFGSAAAAREALINGDVTLEKMVKH